MTPPNSTPVDQLPRVLFVGLSLDVGDYTATGQVLEAVYRCYPGSRQARFTMQLLNIPEGAAEIHMSRWIAPITFIWKGLAHKFRTWAVGFPENRLTRYLRKPKHLEHNAIAPEHPSRKDRRRLSVSALLDLAPIWISRQQVQHLRNVNPDVIHTVVYNAASLQVAIKLSNALGIPVVPQFTDDWVSTIFQNGEMGGLAQWIFRRRLHRLIELSPALIVIGDAMAAEYRRRYHRPCYVVANGVVPDEFEAVAQRSSDSKSILYIGAGYVGRAEQIDRVAELLGPLGWHIRVHAPKSRDWVPVSRNVTHHGEISLEDVPKALVNADALLFVESFRTGFADYTKYSVSTKVPQLIAARRPVLALGPKGQGSIEELRANSTHVYVIDDESEFDETKVAEFLETPIASANRSIPVKYLLSTMQNNFIAAVKFAASS